MRLFRQAVVCFSGARAVLAGVGLLVLGGCLGPNPGFFIASAAASATIFNFVQRFWNTVLGT